MTQFMPHPTNADGLAKLSGTITNLKVTRASASFVFTQSDQTKMGIVAIAAAVAGLSGPAIATAANASSMEEEADYLEFELNGQPIKGWVWRNPFKEGNIVEVAAEPRDGYWEAYGIACPAGKTIALYPHCSRGKAAHIKNALKWWLLGAGGMLLFIQTPIILYVGGFNLFLTKEAVIAYAGLIAFFALVTYSMTRQWMPFVRVAQKVFHALGFARPQEVDLVKTTKEQRTEHDSPELGVFYFRY